ncbi:DgyrCDS7932 [Dimorphilus gyrociliatus]|uniref:Cytochrome c oxidase subunit 5A, mitochondrial n=1 Tax=Dimorphilus gyrociliatus TaxID=2664684 RepID=A0A7I8VUA7_9ANNE|nr:DgyrCDS7932 [Dimorphilus gyrociliatus]
MLRIFTSRVASVVETAARANLSATSIVSRRCMSKHVVESEEEFDARYESFFNRPDIDGWEVRKAMNDIHADDLVPEPKIVIAALKACRRINDYALAVRYLEAIKDKTGPKQGEIWPYMLKELQPTLSELGISTPEEMGYDKPEFASESVYDMH